MSYDLTAAAVTTSGGRVLTGVAVAAISALLYDAGYILEKQALAAMPALRAHPVAILRAGASSRRWLTGFTFMLGGLAMQVIALTVAPVSVVQPVLAGGLVALAAVSGNVLGERHDRRQLASLALVLAAVVAIAVSARSGERVAVTVHLTSFCTMAAPVVLVGGVLAWWGTSAHRGHRPMLAAACGAGLLYGTGAIAEKAVATHLASGGVVSGSIRALATPYPWLFLVTTAGGMLVFQVGLQRHSASLMATFTNVTSTACALLGAAVVFGEGLLPPGWWSVARLLGFGAVVAAIGILAWTPLAGAPHPSELEVFELLDEEVRIQSDADASPRPLRP